jgi:hypothetical protein
MTSVTSVSAFAAFAALTALAVVAIVVAARIDNRNLGHDFHTHTVANRGRLIFVGSCKVGEFLTAVFTS